jgi:hypothetical protein
MALKLAAVRRSSGRWLLAFGQPRMIRLCADLLEDVVHVHLALRQFGLFTRSVFRGGHTKSIGNKRPLCVKELDTRQAGQKSRLASFGQVRQCEQSQQSRTSGSPRQAGQSATFRVRPHLPPSNARSSFASTMLLSVAEVAQHLEIGLSPVGRVLVLVVDVQGPTEALQLAGGLAAHATAVLRTSQRLLASSLVLGTRASTGQDRIGSALSLELLQVLNATRLAWDCVLRTAAAVRLALDARLRDTAHNAHADERRCLERRKPQGVHTPGPP